MNAQTERGKQMSALTKGMLAVLHIGAQQVGLDEDGYRSLLKSCAGVESAAELDRAGWQKAMRRLERAGFRSTSPRRPLGCRPGMASDRELRLIRRLWAEYAPDATDESGLRTWLSNKRKVSDLRFLPADKVPGTIAALRAMIAQRRAREGRPAA